jgi:hypothetical protein
MLYRGTRAVGERLGVPRWPLYVAGRGGVLGDVGAEVAAAAMVFFPPAWFRQGWDEARAIASPPVIAEGYLGGCRAWGRDKLAGFDGAARVAELATRISAAADPAALPLFAAWRAVPLPDDTLERAAQALHVLRELRGGLHGLAVVVSGLTPLEAIVAGPGGTANAEFFGWPGPFPDPAPLAGRRQHAEDLTNDLMAVPAGALDPGERAEFADLVTRATAHAFPA